MDILDKYFMKMPKKRQAFIIIIASGHFLVGLLGFIFKLTNLVESFLIMMIGIFYAEILKLHYRIEKLEKKKKS